MYTQMKRKFNQQVMTFLKKYILYTMNVSFLDVLYFVLLAGLTKKGGVVKLTFIYRLNWIIYIIFCYLWILI